MMGKKRYKYLQDTIANKSRRTAKSARIIQGGFT